MMLRFFAATRGATVLEFALILPVLCALLAGGFELGYRAYVNAILQGALLEASRQATVGDRSGAQIDKIIADRMATLSASISIQSINKESFYNFSNVGKPESSPSIGMVTVCMIAPKIVMRMRTTTAHTT